MTTYTLLASTCSDGDCPSVLRDETTGDYIVRGPLDGDPTRERDLRFTPAQWALLRSVM